MSLDWADNMKAQEGVAICHFSPSQLQIKTDARRIGSHLGDIKQTP